MRVLFLSSETTFPEKVQRWVAAGKLPEIEAYHLVETFGAPEPVEPRVYCIHDFSDRACTYNALKNLAGLRFDAVIGVDEFSGFPAAEFAVMQGADARLVEFARVARDKVLMKEVISRSGVRVPRVYSQTELRSCRYTLPLVAKPRSLAGAVGVEVLRTAAEVQAIVQREGLQWDPTSYTDMNPNEFEVEEFIEGRVFHVDGLFDLTDVVFQSVSEYVIGNCLDYQRGAPLGSRMVVVAESEREAWLFFATRVLREIAARACAFHLECFLTPRGERVFLEIGLRVGGGLIPRSVHEVLGVDLQLNHVRLQMGLVPVLASGISLAPGDTAGFVHFPKCHDSQQPLIVRAYLQPNHAWESDLIYSKMTPIGCLASGPYFSHEDCLAAYLFMGPEMAVTNDMAWISKYFTADLEKQV